MNPTQLLDGFAGTDSSAVSDALDRLSLTPGCGGIRPVHGHPTIVGFAVTVALEPHDGRAAGAHIGTAAVERADDSSVIVVDNGGRTDVSSWGGILSLGAVTRGVRGVIVHGAVRDAGEARELGFPVYARATTPRTARGRLQMRQDTGPVSLGEATVAEGDVVLADETGVVVVPRARAEEVLALAQAIVAGEQAIAAEVRAGTAISQAMHDARLAALGDK